MNIHARLHPLYMNSYIDKSSKHLVIMCVFCVHSCLSSMSFTQQWLLHAHHCFQLIKIMNTCNFRWFIISAKVLIKTVQKMPLKQRRKCYGFQKPCWSIQPFTCGDSCIDLPLACNTGTCAFVYCLLHDSFTLWFCIWTFPIYNFITSCPIRLR